MSYVVIIEKKAQKEFLKLKPPISTKIQRSRLKAKNQHLTRHLRKSTYRTFQ